MMPAGGPVRLVLPSERHVERLSRGGILAGETRATLRARLLDALAPDAVFAASEHTRMALAEVLPAIAESDALLRPIARVGGAGWLRTLDAVDEAIGALRAAGVDAASLASVERAGGAASPRARVLARAMTALDDLLARRQRVDGRAAGAVLARAIASAPPRRVRDVAGAARFVARWIVAWDAADLAWWRALDAALARAVGGGAVVELPSVEGRIDAERDRAPLEVIAFEVARALDAAPHAADIDAPLGDLSLRDALPNAARARIEIRAAIDARAQARAAVDAVRAAIVGGVPVDAIAIGLPAIDEETLEPVRRALDEAKIIAYEPRGSAPMRAGLVACAFAALGVASRGLPRREVAALVRSRYVDASRIAGGDDPGRALEECEALARTLDETAAVRADDPVASLAATADGDARVRRVGELLAKPESARTRAEHVAAARAVWAGLGLAPRVGRRSARALASDEVATGLVRAELHAVARDARGWRALNGALDDYERAALDLDLGGHTLSSDAFRHELGRVLGAAPPPSSAGRAGAVRFARIAELACEPLALLVVIDANDGTLPSSVTREALLGDALVEALRLRTGAAPPTQLVRGARDMRRSRSQPRARRGSSSVIARPTVRARCSRGHRSSLGSRAAASRRRVGVARRSRRHPSRRARRRFVRSRRARARTRWRHARRASRGSSASASLSSSASAPRHRREATSRPTRPARASSPTRPAADRTRSR